MGRVIELFTREDVTDKAHSISKEDGELILTDLLNIEANRSESVFGPMSDLISHMCYMVENASGADRFEAMEKIYNQTKLNK